MRIHLSGTLVSLWERSDGTQIARLDLVNAASERRAIVEVPVSGRQAARLDALGVGTGVAVDVQVEDVAP